MHACYKHGNNTVVVHKKQQCLFCLVEGKLAQVIDRPNQSECIYGFVGWLSTLPIDLKIGAQHECSILVTLINAYMKENDLPPVSDSYPKNLSFPPESEMI